MALGMVDGGMDVMYSISCTIVCDMQHYTHMTTTHRCHSPVHGMGCKFEWKRCWTWGHQDCWLMKQRQGGQAMYTSSLECCYLVIQIYVQVVIVHVLQHNNLTNCEEFVKVKCTCEQYERYLCQGKEFLEACIKQWWKTFALQKDRINDDLLAKAFDAPPNKLSATALELFLIEKCLHKGLGEGTGISIHAAFAWYWDNM